jgi:hypothetical protein
MRQNSSTLYRSQLKIKLKAFYYQTLTNKSKLTMKLCNLKYLYLSLHSICANFKASFRNRNPTLIMTLRATYHCYIRILLLRLLKCKKLHRLQIFQIAFSGLIRPGFQEINLRLFTNFYKIKFLCQMQRHSNWCSVGSLAPPAIYWGQNQIQRWVI